MHIFEAWLSLVERCVRDAEVASSNLVASIFCSFTENAGIAQQVEHFTRNEGVVSSNLISSLIAKARDRDGHELLFLCCSPHFRKKTFQQM